MFSFGLVYWKRFWQCLFLLCAFMASSVQAKEILIVGDSLTCGPFGAELVKKLVAQNNKVELYCGVSSSPRHWLNGTNPQQQNCNHCSDEQCTAWYNKATPDESYLELCQISGDGNIPRMQSILEQKKFDQVVIALGTNSLPATKVDLSYGRLMTVVNESGIVSRNWVGPPHFSTEKGQEAADMDRSLAGFYQSLQDSMQPPWQLIDSRAFTQNPSDLDTAKDGVHRKAASGRKWASEVFPLVKGEEIATVTKEKPRGGTSFTELLMANGFSCKERSATSVCTIPSLNLPGLNYSEPVAVVVPPGLERPKNIILHLHGFKGVCEDSDASATAMVREFHFPEQLQAAGANDSVLFFPMSTGKCDTYRSELVPQFKAFIQWIDKVANVPEANWILSGHSGAGAILSKALSQHSALVKKMKGLILLDATYGIPAHLGEWGKIAGFMKASSLGGTIFSAYLPGTSTASGSETLKDYLDDRGISAQFGPALASSHCVVPSKDFGSILAKILGKRSKQKN